jgi:hypothetical protein
MPEILLLGEANFILKVAFLHSPEKPYTLLNDGKFGMVIFES